MSSAKVSSTTRFERKREDILLAAQDLLYRQGLKGMTLADVAAKVGLNATAVTYYFKKKEDLAAACFSAGIARLDAIMSDAARGATLRERLQRVIGGFFARHRAARLGEDAQISPFGELRSLDEPHRSVLNSAFAQMFAKARALFDAPELAALNQRARTARAHFLLEQIFWSAAWLHRYDVEDYPRVSARTCSLLIDGMAPEDGKWRDDLTIALPSPERPAGPDMSREDFLIAATRLINRVGHRGASVEKISAELNVTKGSFYHHIDAKEDLVEACFHRTYDIMRRVQSRALAESGTQWEAIQRAVSGLVQIQVSPAGPLLRTSAIITLPEPLRTRVADRLNRIVDRFASMAADAIAEGSMRGVDPMIAAQMIKVAINSAAEAPQWVRGLEPAETPSLYARPALFGAAVV